MGICRLVGSGLTDGFAARRARLPGNVETDCNTVRPGLERGHDRGGQIKITLTGRNLMEVDGATSGLFQGQIGFSPSSVCLSLSLWFALLLPHSHCAQAAEQSFLLPLPLPFLPLDGCRPLYLTIDLLLSPTPSSHSLPNR